MYHKTNPLKNISKKIKNFSIFLNFVLKKMLSLHLVEKSSVFRYALLFKNVRVFRNNGKNEYGYRNSADSLVCRYWVNSHSLEKQM